MKPQSNRRKLLVDTDPGGDDIFALLWLQSLAKQGFAELVAVTTVDGNVRAKSTFSSASKILNLGGFEAVEVGRAVPFHPGIIEDAAYLHGDDGMGHLSHTLPELNRQFEDARYSDEIIIEKLEANPGEITVIGLAPLTNLAAAEVKRPGILKLAKEVVLMAGAFQTRGNVTPLAEFNVAYNPEAADKVLSSRDDMILIPLDVTHDLILTVEMTAAIARTYPEHPIAQLIHDLCRFMSSTSLRYKETAGIEGFLVHDAVTVAYLFYPETLLFRRAFVNVETKGEYSKGQTFFDRRHGAKTQANAFVALQADRVNLLAILIEDLKYAIAG